MKLFRLACVGCCAVLALALGGCASTRLVDSNVSSFTGAAPLPANATYRFERLPSQQAQTPQRSELESWVQAALTRKGLVRNDAQAQLSVQMQVQIEQIVEYPLLHRHPFASLYRPLDRRLWMRPSALDLEPNWFRYSVHLVLRDTATGVAAYETRAMHEGPWSDSGLLLPAVLDAALADYPNAVPTSHTVEVPVVRSSVFGQ